MLRLDIVCDRCAQTRASRFVISSSKGVQAENISSLQKSGFTSVIERDTVSTEQALMSTFRSHGASEHTRFLFHSPKLYDNARNGAQEEGCKKYRVYGFDGKPALCCASHKREGMVDVRSSRCEFAACFRHPSFGYKWEKKRRFCGRHKLTDMVDVRSRNQAQVCNQRCCRLAFVSSSYVARL